MSPKVPKVPSYRYHKARNQACVTLSGQTYYLGPWKSAESKTEYERLIAEWLARGKAAVVPASDLTVMELAAAYRQWANDYFQKDGETTRSAERVELAMKELCLLHGRQPVVQFGPLALQAIQTRLANRGLARGYVNDLIAMVKACFKWAASQELIPVTIHQAVWTVPGLRRGRSKARETAPIPPVAEEVVDATLAYLAPIPAAIVRFQRLTSCRPGEACKIRPIDVDRSSDVWVYRPSSHKTEHHGHERAIPIGPRAQAVLLPYLLRESTAPCFSPIEAEAARIAGLRERRKSKVQPSQWNRKKPKPQRKPGTAYDPLALARAISRAADKAGVPHWHPNQLRHSAATAIRKRFGLEAAQVSLGHARADVTQIYAEKNLALAAQVAREVG